MTTGHVSDKIGNTIVLNAGMFRDGWYIEVAIDKGGLSAVLKLVQNHPCDPVNFFVSTS